MKRAASVALLLAASLIAGGQPEDPIDWKPWSASVLAQAKKERKLVLLNLEAVWCHWCHVMDDTTYRDPAVAKLIQARYLPVRADQDADPALSKRYEDWGWPATIIFAPDGAELAKRRGYIPPDRMAAMLQAFADDPAPGPSVLPEVEVLADADGALNPEQRQALLQEHDELYDREFGGWGARSKLIQPESMEWAITQALAGDPVNESRARRTLDEALKLLDPAWGGFYQYSDRQDWSSPHFEKIMWVQAAYIRLYALANAVWDEPLYLRGATKTAGYVRRFWTSPDGAFYTSQDADVDGEMRGAAFYDLPEAPRAALGRMPRIDTRLYARENGLMIRALASLYDATEAPAYLDAAARSARWVIAHRALPKGGFRHDERDAAGPYLGDTLAMGEAFLGLYASTADREWLQRAEAAAKFIQANFREADAGYRASPVPRDAQGALRRPVRAIDEHIALARWANSLHRYTGKKAYREMAQRAMKYLASSAVLKHRTFLTGILQADAELASEPLHVTVIGPKDDPLAIALYNSARQYPSTYRRIEWWDRREGPLPNNDVAYPQLPEAAAFICTNSACSLPQSSPEALTAAIDTLRAG